jgi:cytochrome b involved in lipid metabolism
MRRETVARLLVLAAFIGMAMFSGCVEEDEAPPENTFSLEEEVAQHNSAQDCWIVVQGKVYNVTTIPCHGGGASALILDSCGTDATELWVTKPVTEEPHSQEAQDILDDYYIGDLG